MYFFSFAYLTSLESIHTRLSLSWVFKHWWKRPISRQWLCTFTVTHVKTRTFLYCYCRMIFKDQGTQRIINERVISYISSRKSVRQDSGEKLPLFMTVDLALIFKVFINRSLQPTDLPMPHPLFSQGYHLQTTRDMRPHPSVTLDPATSHAPPFRSRNQSYMRAVSTLSQASCVSQVSVQCMHGTEQHQQETFWAMM